MGTAPNTSASASVSVTPAGETEASGVSDGSASDTMDNISETSTNVQIPDNIKLDLGNVYIVYEINGGISNIEIRNQRETARAVENMVEVMAAGVEEPAANAQTVNWYEVIKMFLLAAIFIVVVPKPSLGLKKES